MGLWGGRDIFPPGDNRPTCRPLKEVTRRGIIGGILFGPVGAVLGGLTALDKEEQIEEKRTTRYLAVCTANKTLLFTVPDITANVRTYNPGITDWVLERMPNRETVLTD
jgi:hypothetical protein